MNRQMKKIISVILVFFMIIAPSQVVFATEDVIIEDSYGVIENDRDLESSEGAFTEDVIIEDTGDNHNEIELGETDKTNTAVTESPAPEMNESISREDGMELGISDTEPSSEVCMTAYDVLGIWEGHYTEIINDASIQELLYLDIEECTEDGGLCGIATIDDMDGGKYYFEGTADFLTGSISFSGIEWLENPYNLDFSSFSGQLRLENMTISGMVDGNEERPFILSKTSYDYGILSAQTDNEKVIDAPDYDTWLASTMLYGYENSGNGLYTTFQSLSEPVYMELGGYLLDDVPLVSMSTAWSVFFNSEYRNQFANEQKYIYEIILMEYLKYDSGNKSVKNELINNEIKFSMKLYDIITKDMTSNKKDYINGLTVDEAIEFYENADVLEKIGPAISELKDGVESVKDLINVFSEYMALQQVRDERVYLLKEAKNACASSNYPNSDFIKATDELINIIEGSALQYVQGESLDFLWGQGCDYAWSALCNANPILKSIELGVSGLDVCFDSTNVASNNLKLALLYTTDHYLKQGMMNATSGFMSNNSSVNAQTFLACFQAYMQFQMYGNDFAKTWLNGYLDSGVISSVVNMIFYRENISTAKDLIDRSDTQTSNRKNIIQLIDKYANMYQHIYEDSDWKEMVDDANIPVTGVSFSNSQVTLANKSSLFLAYANIEPSNATNKNITYTSSDPSILSVPENGGFATVKGSGTVTVEAKTEEGSFAATQTVIIGSGISLSEIASGSCGENVRWILFEDGTLYIYGSGAMKDCRQYNYGSTSNNITDAPWFSDKDNIVSINVSDGITYIGNSAFAHCDNLKNVIIPDSVVNMGNNVFYSCDSLTSISLPNGITKLGNGVLSLCSSLNHINLPEGLESMGDEVFYYCENLNHIDLPEGLISIGDNTFSYCKNLNSINLPSGLTNLGTSMFYYCRNLYDIELPPHLVQIGALAFYGSGLIKIEIPESVKTIEGRAFGYCESLSEIIIPKTVENIGSSVFNDTPWFESHKEEFVIINNHLISYNWPNNTIYPKSIKIPEGVVKICGEFGHQGRAYIKEINLPDGLKTIGSSAFSGFSSLKNMMLPDTVNVIESSAFYDCYILSSISLSDNVTEIGSDAFFGCDRLKLIEIPENVKTISPRALGYTWNGKKIEDLTIIGKSGSAAEAYAISNGFAFRAVAKSQDIHSYATAIVKKQTCTDTGISRKECNVCHRVKKGSEKTIPAIGHKYGPWKTTKKATVFSEGVQVKTCSICGKSSTKAIAKLKPTVEFTASSIKLKIKQSTSALKAIGLAKGDAVKSWKSSNKKIVKVNSKGKITAQSKTGNATITVTLKSGLYKKIAVKVQKSAVSCTKVTLNKSSVSLEKGKSLALKPKVKPITCVQKIKYSSSNKKVATVSSKGKVTAKKKGKATITVTVGKKKVKCKVTVK